MLRSATLLIRTSLPSVLVLTVSLVVISNILAGEPDDNGASASDGMPPLTLPSHRPPGAGSATAILQNAIFDPDRRPESIAGSIDDLRGGGKPAAPAPVTIAGVLLSGGERKAMLAVGGGAPAWHPVGADVNGWRVAVVDEAGAVLERDGQSLALKVVDRFKLRTRPDVAPPPSEAPASPEAAPPPMPEPPDIKAPNPP